MSDEIIQELWRIKDTIAKKFDYDINSLADELRKREATSKREILNLAAIKKGLAKDTSNNQ